VKKKYVSGFLRIPENFDMFYFNLNLIDPGLSTICVHIFSGRAAYHAEEGF
jgi:hypothetical protein